MNNLTTEDINDIKAIAEEIKSFAIKFNYKDDTTAQFCYEVDMGMRAILEIINGPTGTIEKNDTKKPINNNEVQIIKEKYESAKKLAEELWLDGDHEGTSNDFYYFQCGFVSGMNYKLYEDYSNEK